jgi:hypothetical protein
LLNKKLREMKMTIQVTKQSIITKKMNTMELPITQEHLDMYETVGDILVQDAFPNLDIGQREFLISGITPQEWNETFGEEGDDE